MKNFTLKLVRRLTFVGFLLTIPTHATETPYIISGFDDVLRQAENTGLIKAALKIFEPDKTFTGMPELYQEISRQEKEPHFVLVSAISHWFDGRIEKFLSETNYPPHKRYLRNWLTEWSISGFKISKIDEIIKGHSGREFIVIFDNSDPSLAMATELAQRYPQIRKVYLRMVVEKKLPQEATSFYSAFDIALREFEDKRLEAQVVERIAQIILGEKKREMLFPDYALCPNNYRPCEGTAFLTSHGEVCLALQLHVERLCQAPYSKGTEP